LPGVGRDDDRAEPFRYAVPGRATESVVADGAGHARQERYLTEPLSLDDRQGALPLTITRPADPPVSAAAPAAPSRVPAWQLHGRYVLAHVRDGLIVIDQNLAHRRVIYERILGHFTGEPGPSQVLLFPQTFEFGLNQLLVVREAMPLLGRMGFGIRDFGGNAVLVDAAPAGLDDWGEGRVFRQMIDALVHDSSTSLGLEDRPVPLAEHALAASFARATAVPHGKAMSLPEMQALIDQLFATKEPFLSPEGRPTVARIGMDEIDRRFRG
jgi:DNA mismatch repair protein MutL